LQGAVGEATYQRGCVEVLHDGDAKFAHVRAGSWDSSIPEQNLAREFGHLACQFEFPEEVF